MKSLIATSIVLCNLMGMLPTAWSQASAAEAPQREPEASVTALLPGSLDPTFQKSLSSFGNGGGFATHIAQLPNHQALVVFSVLNSNNQRFIVVRRYNEDGSHDRSFGGPGEVQATIKGGMPDLAPNAIVVTPEGRIFVAVTGFAGSLVRPLIFTLTSSGTRDTTTLDGDGLFTPVTTIANPNVAKIFAADLSYDAVTQKLTLGGTVDPNNGNSFLWTFTVNVNGVAPFTETVVKETAANLSFEKFRRRSNGEMVIAGGIVSPNGGIPRGFLVRQLSDGLIVRKSIDVVGFKAFITGLQVDAGSVFLAGAAFTTAGFDTEGFVARFNLETLTVDTAFGNNGIRFVSDDVRGLAFSNGSGTAKEVLVAGSDGTDYMVARMSYDGQMDASFGDDGIALVNFSNAVDERTLALSVDSANRIWAAGLTESFNDSGFRAGLFRLLP
jgi:hypothetical protein